MQSKRARKIAFFAADLLLFHLALFITLALRYGSLPDLDLWLSNQLPFLIVYFLWMVIFYVAGLYDMEKFISEKEIRNRTFKTMITAGVLAIMIFYLVPYFKITPKTTLVMNTMIVFFLVWFWRKIFFIRAAKSSKIKIFFPESGEEIKNLAELINSRPQMGYETTENLKDANIVIASKENKKNNDYVQALYEIVRNGKTVMDFDKFYELVTGKIPVSLIGKTWFLENLLEINKQAFEKAKRTLDVTMVVLLLVPFLALFPFIALLIKTTSKGPVFYRQKRVGKNGKIFEIVKFRSMMAGAEKNGAQWAKEKDERVTMAGNFLRAARLDELPQIWNILKGDLSFIGPRPERPEFTEELEKQIPHYSMRHLIKPGLSGWAQINFPYGASVEDAMEKLQYDLFYIKNRSLLLEISIILKTIMIILSHSGR